MPDFIMDIGDGLNICYGSKVVEKKDPTLLSNTNFTDIGYIRVFLFIILLAINITLTILCIANIKHFFKNDILFF